MTTETQQQPYRSIWADLRGVSFSQGWINAGGINTRYLHSGSTDKPALILLHGTGGHAEAYVRNLKAHGEHFSTWAIDMVGHGWSDQPKNDLEIKDYCAHLLAFMDAIGVKKAHISGESMGGWIASRFAIDHPDRVDRIVLNTAGGSQSDPVVMEKIRTISMRAATDPNWDFVKSRLEWLMADKDRVFDDLVATRQAIYSQPGYVDTMRHIVALQDPSCRERNVMTASDYAKIKAPTLVLWTSHDPTASVKQGRWIASQIPGALFTVMDDCGHWPQFEDTPTFNRIHLAFLLGQPVPEAEMVNDAKTATA